MTADQPTQGEKRAALRNDTLLRRAMNSADDEAGGRFAKVNKTVVNGASPRVEYPAAGGPWADGPRVPDEPPLGFSIDAMEPVGEYHEVQASLGEAAAPAGVASTAVETSSPTPTRSVKRRRLG